VERRERVRAGRRGDARRGRAPPDEAGRIRTIPDESGRFRTRPKNPRLAPDLERPARRLLSAVDMAPRRPSPLPAVLTLLIAAPPLAHAAPPAIEINGRPATERDRAVLADLSRASGQPTQPGRYWYDAATGAFGLWGGPTVGFVAAHLELGGRLPTNASGGGHGNLTGVFINGRELHPQDVLGLSMMMGVPVQRGRWWVDARGNAGAEGGPALFNIFMLARQNRAAGGGSYFRSGGGGDSTYVGQGCASVHGSLGTGDSKSAYSYYVGCD
jgi:hypothetical protein